MASFSSYWTVVQLEQVHDLARLLRQAVLLDEGKDRQLDRGQCSRDAHHRALGTVLERFHTQGVGQDGEEHAVQADGGLHHEQGT